MADDDALFSKGMPIRREVLGPDYVDASMARADEFMMSFQRATTAWAWGWAWGDQTLDRKTRSLMNLAMLPMWVFSGVFFSSSHFPAVMQPVIKALPLTATNDALRAVMLEGAGLREVFPEVAVLLVWLILSFGLALKLFRWT